MILLAVLVFAAVLLALGPGPGRVLRRPGSPLPAADMKRMGTEQRRGVPRLLRTVILPGFREDSAAQWEDMAATVQQLAALLASGRPAPQIWGELHRFHVSQGDGVRSSTAYEASLRIVAAASRATGLGESPARAIRRELAERRPGSGRISVTLCCWDRIALCVRASELSGCPLGALLARLAVDLEHSADAEGARRAALAGPRASVALLSWLPFLGLGLGLLLGVDPARVIGSSPLGVVSVVAGLILWAVGRMWSRTLVALAEGRT